MATSKKNKLHDFLLVKRDMQNLFKINFIVNKYNLTSIKQNDYFIF